MRTGSRRTKLPRTIIKVNGTDTEFIIDTRAGLNILDKEGFDNLHDKPKLDRTNIHVRAYKSDKPITILGKFRAKVQVQERKAHAIFYVTDGCDGSLLTCDTAEAIELVTVDRKLLLAVGTEAETDPLYEGVGLLKDFSVKLHIDDSVPPVAKPHRRIPINLREKVEDKLRQLEKDGIIEKADGPTPWVSQPLFPPKSDDPTDIRMCVDMRSANKAILRTRHITPTIEEIVSDLNGAVKFSKLDLSQGYHQLMLDEDSRYITTFTTHMGLWRYKRLNFGMCCASEIFQNAIRETLGGISGVLNASDDILVYGKSPEEHDKNLQQVLLRLREKGLTLNKKKCVFGRGNLKYLGYIFSKEGARPCQGI